MEYRYLMKDDQHRKIWKQSFANYMGRLVQGVGKKVKEKEKIYLSTIPISQANAAKTLHITALWETNSLKKRGPTVPD